MMNDNLRLWNDVQQTDPKHTKHFTKGGGFSGTAINATYQIKRATEQWGPLGGAWGYSITNSEYVPGAKGDVIHVLQIEFRTPSGSFPAFGQTTFVGSNKNGQFTDEEAPKKSLTDAITKALSMLGFSADVFLGLYDDNKYVEDLKGKIAADVPASAKSVSQSTYDELPLDIQKRLSDAVIPVKGLLAKNLITQGYDVYKEIHFNDELQQVAIKCLFTKQEGKALKDEGIERGKQVAINKRKESESQPSGE